MLGAKRQHELTEDELSDLPQYAELYNGQNLSGSEEVKQPKVDTNSDKEGELDNGSTMRAHEQMEEPQSAPDNELDGDGPFAKNSTAIE